jgi:starch synthase
MFNNSNSVYEGGSDGARFDFFCKAALEFMLSTARQPDIIHCHDWSTAMAAKFLWEDYHNAGLWKPRAAFTIHNLEFGQAKIGDAMYNAQVWTLAARPHLPLRDDSAPPPAPLVEWRAKWIVSGSGEVSEK